MNYYTVYDNKTEEIVVSGNAIKCAAFLKIKIESFYYAISRQKRNKRGGRYTIVVEKD